MVKVISGKKGTGKTKVMINSANEIVKNDKGTVVYVDPSNSHIYDLDKKIRYVSLSEFDVNDSHSLLTFIEGSLAQNYDIDVIFIDALNKITSSTIEELEDYFDELDKVSKKFGVDFYISATFEPKEAPEFIKVYM